MSVVNFKTFLNIHTYSTHILMEGNPWNCDCDLQRVFRKLRFIQRLFLDDYTNLTCREPPVLEGYRLMEVDQELCIARQLRHVMGERKRKRKKKAKHWTQQGELSEESDY
ncbi:hypothetical protein WMY93_022530 [Mugilogobius chulae]|uniref:LRRCT domain-containing protein n=1 Tax=Mugilogobius chulae TaxID=88201 RepID=A0AAW0N8R7_9GOBI